MSQATAGEIAGLELQALQVENLINVTIEPSSYKGILGEVSSDNQGIQATRMDSLKQVRKKWQRNKGKENVKHVQCGLLSSEDVTMRKKRNWQLRDEKEEQENSVVQHKKLRGVTDCEMDDIVEVGVASLK